jgi:hypothetical protein
MADGNGNGSIFNFNSNGSGRDSGGDGGSDPFYEDSDEDEEGHEHEYANIAQTPNLSAYEELVHQVITLEFHDRGLTLDFSYEEAEELGQVLADIINYLSRKRTYEP